MDCLRRTHKEQREHRAVRRRRVHGHRGVGDARRPCGGTTAVRRRWRVQLQALCPYAPLDNSYSYAMGVLLLRVARHLAGEIASLLLLQQAACLATAATSGYVRNGFINWLNVTFIELQPLHYHCRRQV